jgi:hypothetical protein
MRKRNRCEGSLYSCFAICLRRYSLTAASINLALYAQACLATLGSPVGAFSTRPCLVRHRYSRFLSGHSNSNWSHRNPLPPRLSSAVCRARALAKHGGRHHLAQLLRRHVRSPHSFSTAPFRLTEAGVGSGKWPACLRHTSADTGRTGLHCHLRDQKVRTMSVSRGVTLNSPSFALLSLCVWRLRDAGTSCAPR